MCFMAVFQQAVSLPKPYNGATEVIERPQFFIESHQRELLTLAQAEAARGVLLRAGPLVLSWHRGHGARRANNHHANRQ